MPAPPPAPPKPSPTRTPQTTARPTTIGNGQPARTFGTSSGVSAAASKVILYGPGGIGKTKLASLLSEVGVRPLFIDIEDGSRMLDVDRVTPTPETFAETLDVLRNDAIFAGFGAIVLDSLTKADELAVGHTLATVPHEKGHFVTSVEAYGYGKGQGHVYETFLLLLQELDRHARAGRHVICIAHECTANVPNPAGEDWIRYEPRLQSPASGKASIRHRCKEWCDHLLYVGYDTIVNKEGKAQGGGSRTIYTQEMPCWWAKSRSLADPIPYYDGDAELWKQLIQKRS